MSTLRSGPSGGLGTPSLQKKSAGNSGAVKSIDWSQYCAQDLLLTANCTLTCTGFPPGQATWCQLKVTQDATGGRTLNIVGDKSPGGTGLTLSPAPNAIDIVSLFWDGTALFAQVAGLAYA